MFLSMLSDSVTFCVNVQKARERECWISVGYIPLGAGVVLKHVASHFIDFYTKFFDAVP
jgi:hypothetical protein